MSRTTDEALRSDLLDRAVDYVCKHGVSGLALRPMAKAIGSSPGVLLYHFASKESLLSEIIGSGRKRQQEMLSRIELGSDLSPREVGRIVWRAWSSPRWEPLVRLFFEVYALALQDRSRFPGFLESAVAQWLQFLEGSLPDAGTPHARATATLMLACFRGCFLDVLATRDRARVGRAIDQLFDLLDRAAEGNQTDAVR